MTAARESEGGVPLAHVSNGSKLTGPAMANARQLYPLIAVEGVLPKSSALCQEPTCRDGTLLVVLLSAGNCLHLPLQIDGLLARRQSAPRVAREVPPAELPWQEISPVDVERACQSGNRIGHRMNNILPKLFRVAQAGQCARAGRLNSTVWIALDAPPDDVVFAAGVKAESLPTFDGRGG